MERKRGRSARRQCWQDRQSSLGQISIEYLVITGMALLILIPGSYLFYKYSRTTNDQVVRGQIDVAGSQILSQAKSVYSFGKNNRVTIEIEVPSAVKNITMYDGSELVFTYDSGAGTQEALFFSNVNITGLYQEDASVCPTGWCSVSRWSPDDIAYGLISLQIESQGLYVTINQTH